MTDRIEALLRNDRQFVEDQLRVDPAGLVDNDEAMSSVCKFHGAQAALA